MLQLSFGSENDSFTPQSKRSYAFIYAESLSQNKL